MKVKPVGPGTFVEFQLGVLRSVLANVGSEGMTVEQWASKHGVRPAIDGEFRREQEPALLRRTSALGQTSENSEPPGLGCGASKAPRE